MKSSIAFMLRTEHPAPFTELVHTHLCFFLFYGILKNSLIYVGFTLLFGLRWGSNLNQPPIH